MDVRYVNASGDEAVLDGGPGSATHCSRGSALDWSYSVKELNGRCALTRFDPTEFSLAVTVSGPGAAAEMDRLADVLAADAGAAAFGRLYVGEWYRACVPLSMEHDWCQRDAAFLVEVTFRADDPAWVRTEEQELVDPGGTGLDYPYDHPHDLGAPSQTDSVRNRSPVACPVRIRVTGPATGWSVRIGTNVYRCALDLLSGEMATVDGSSETITVTRADGTVENAFSSWRGTFKEGSGSYVFEPVPPGESPVSWEGCSGVAVTVYERRAELRWSA